MNQLQLFDTRACTTYVVKPVEDIPVKNIRLSPRELEIMRGIADGYTHEQIAYMLGISRQTVQGHLEDVRRKTGRPSIASAMYIITKLGLLE